MKIHQDNARHMTKMAAMLLYRKTLKIFFPGTTGLILMKLCMKLPRHILFIFSSNNDPLLTLTYFMSRSKFAS